MHTSVLSGEKSPYCPGCGHQLVTNNMSKALETMGLDPLDVVVVSDIGCCGLVDGLLSCHTLHGLHGRAVPLAMGVRMGLDHQKKKVIAIQGDGGATIGLQHLLEAARENIDMTLIVQNNMVYGMTGGQISGLTPAEFQEDRIPEAGVVPSYDICELAHSAGAAYTTRTFVGGDTVDLWMEALSIPGFSLVEIVEICPSYGIRKIKDLHEMADHQEVTLKHNRPPASVERRGVTSLFDALPAIERTCEANLDTRLEVIIAGSAGEAIQSAGELLACAGVAAGLSATKKGEYPITVGTGFSIVEVIFSRDTIHYTGIESPDVMIITSQDGFENVKDRIGPHTRLILDIQVDITEHPHRTSGDFHKLAGKKGAALAAVTFWLQDSGILPVEALIEAAGRHKHTDALIATIKSVREKRE